MALDIDIVLPAAHSQKDAPHDRDMMEMIGVNSDLAGGASRNLKA